MQFLVIPVAANDSCSAGMEEDDIFEADEIYTDTEKDRFQSMMDEFSQENEVKPPQAPTPTCPFGHSENILNDEHQEPQMPSFDGLLPSFGDVPSLMPGAGIDPEALLKVLFNVMNLLETKVLDTLNENEAGVCSQVEPINVFLEKEPYMKYQDLLNKTEGLDALKQIENLRSEVKMKMGGF